MELAQYHNINRFVSVFMYNDRYSPSANTGLTETCSVNINLNVLCNITGTV